MPTCPECGLPLSRGGYCANCISSAGTMGAGSASQITETGGRVGGVPVAPNIPGYTILSLLGSGGMGSVFLAEDCTLRRRVAIKIISAGGPASVDVESRFLREAQMLAMVEDPNVVHVHSYGTTDHIPYLVMEYVEGKSVAQVLGERKRLPVDEVCRIAIQVSHGLLSASRSGIIHRDVKPANILIDKRENARVADFGLARSVQAGNPDALTCDALTQEGVVVGTPHYMPPEQAQGGEITAAGDVYSLGITIYEMLTGTRPFTGATPIAIIAKHIHEPLPDPRRQVRGIFRGIPPRLVRLIRAMTEKEPRLRPKYEEIITALEDSLQTYTVGQTQVSGRQALLTVLFILCLLGARLIAPFKEDASPIRAAASILLAFTGGALMALLISGWGRRK